MRLEDPIVDAHRPGFHDPALYDRGYPHDLFRRLRAEEPVSHHEHPDYEGGYWLAVRHADVQAVSRSPSTWANAPAPIVETPPGGPTEPGFSFLLDLDGPAHTEMRRIVSKAFTPRRVAELEDRLRHRMAAIIDSLRARTRGDLVADLATTLPLHVIGDMIGIPEADRMKVFELSERMAGYDPAVTPEESGEAMEAIFEYAQYLGDQRRADPQDDLLSAIVASTFQGGPLSYVQQGMFFLVLSSGGADTTRNLVVSGTAALLQNRAQYDRLRGRPELLPTGVEELLRYTSPVMYFCRQARHDTTVGGVPIGAGERVMLAYPSANRDERVFDRPDELDVTRAPNDHVAFGGGGPHFCLGANLARVEGRVIFEAILDRFEGLELAADPATLRHTHHNIIHGYLEMPITWTAIR